ncbi:MAG TPA: hypothetical protein DCY35_05590, partial [Prolixibacteraceae bacterium]|nr:hypothetical protein [Prolixibacteraceae bacterium]
MMEVYLMTRMAGIPCIIGSVIIFVMIALMPACSGRTAVNATFQNYKIVNQQIVDPKGNIIWRINQSAKEGTIQIDKFGRLSLYGHKDGECSISLEHSLKRDDVVQNPAGYVLEAGVILDRPEVLSYPQAAAVPQILFFTVGGRYRIVYQTSLVWNKMVTTAQTTWFLYDMESEDYIKNTIKSIPLAVARYRLFYGELYTAYTRIKTVDGKVNISFYLDDTVVSDDEKKPLIDWTQETASELVDPVVVQMGCVAVDKPASRLFFQRIRLYSDELFEIMRADNEQRREALIHALDFTIGNSESVTADTFIKKAIYYLGQDIEHGLFGSRSAVGTAKSLGMLKSGDILDSKQPMTRLEAARISTNVMGEAWPAPD